VRGRLQRYVGSPVSPSPWTTGFRHFIASVTPHAYEVSPVDRIDWPLRPLPTPVTDRLFAALQDADLAAIRAAASSEELALLDSRPDEVVRKRLLISLGVHHSIAGVLDRTGLSSAEPPDEVHSMERGWTAAGGSSFHADLVFGSLEAAVVQVQPGSRILDFGCSSGRVVRTLQPWRPDLEYFACDPNGPAIEWARANLRSIEFSANAEVPPLTFRDSFFGLVYAISIWSHFSQRAALAWFDEMHRILEPGGLLVITTHGLHSALQPGANPTRAGSPGLLGKATAGMLSSGFYFWDCFGIAGDWGVTGPDWGEAFISPEWIGNMLPPRWEMLMFATAANLGNQDLVVLRSRKPADGA